MPTHATRAPRPNTILPLNDVVPLAQSLAQKETHRPDDVDDLIQVGLFAYHKAEVRARKLKTPIRRPWAFARMTLQRAIRAYYWQQREWQTRGEPNKAIGIDQVGVDEPEFMMARSPMLVVGLDGRISDGEQVELLEMDDYFAALQRTCGHRARLMVENLMAPTGRCCAHILGEAKAKREAQQSFNGRSRSARRHQPRGVKKAIRISHRLVREGLGMTPTEWTQHMDAIRLFTRDWLTRHHNSKPGVAHS